MGRDRDTERGRSVESREARTHGNDPDAVRIERGGERNLGRTEERTTTEVRHVKEGNVGDGRTRYEGASYGGSSRDEDGLEGVTRRDSVRWGPIWAGLITAITTFLLLQLLAIGLGLVGIGPNSNGGGGWVPAVVGLIAFFTGGAVAGMVSAVRGAATGLLNGFLVWALGTVLIVLLSALGLGQIFGALGNVVGQLGVLQGGGLSVPNNVPNPDISPAQVAQAVRTGAIGAFFGLLISALASALGGFLGGRSSDPVGSMTDAPAER